MIIVDGGSTDSSVAVAKTLISNFSIREKSTIKWHSIESKAGRASQMNSGAEKASSEVLLFLHADTQMPITAIKDISLARQQN